ncbi:hypothetical protein [Pseudoxanthomonas indica]|uniref:hypothetical protein n=1 Tax=Pseudoxanthomonas indica TaxID=428993 RepID=UPI001117A700|nr:hypothetical protein [Pseudoxanthomonas indica]GGD52488.1 hypothetical protein GCM10007235_25870 [Pseudoxanthomonas indica]
MERREPTFEPDEPIEFRPRSYRGPSSPVRNRDEYLVLKVSTGTGLGFLIALLVYNAFDRYQDRKDAEFALKQLSTELARQNAEDERFLRENSINAPTRAPARQLLRPLAPDERCIKGDRFKRIDRGWVQIAKEPCRD